MHLLGRVVAQPRFGAVDQVEEVLGGAADHRGDQPGRALVDVDLVVEIETVRQRHLVEQQVLRRQLPVVRQRVVAGFVAVHVHVEPAHGVRERADVDHQFLLAKPLGEPVEVRQVAGLADAARLAAGDRHLELVDAGQVGDREVAVAAELNRLVEVLDELVAHLVDRHDRDQSDRDDGGSDQDRLAARHHQIAQEIEDRGSCVCSSLLDPHR